MIREIPGEVVHIYAAHTSYRLVLLDFNDYKHENDTKGGIGLCNKCNPKADGL